MYKNFRQAADSLFLFCLGLTRSAYNNPIGPRNDNAGLLTCLRNTDQKYPLRKKKTSVKIKQSFRVHFKISHFCANFVFLHQEKFQFLQYLGLIDMLSANQNAGIFVCILLGMVHNVTVISNSE